MRRLVRLVLSPPPPLARPTPLGYLVRGPRCKKTCENYTKRQSEKTWWHKSGQLEAGSLLNKRYVRYDNSLVISAFKPLDFEPDIHSTSYKCQASNSLGTIVSRDVVINAGE